LGMGVRGGRSPWVDSICITVKKSRASRRWNWKGFEREREVREKEGDPLGGSKTEGGSAGFCGKGGVKKFGEIPGGKGGTGQREERAIFLEAPRGQRCNLNHMKVIRE